MNEWMKTIYHYIKYDKIAQVLNIINGKDKRIVIINQKTQTYDLKIEMVLIRMESGMSMVLWRIFWIAK